MTAPEREALVKALRRYPLCASDCIVSQCKSFCVYALVKEAADMIEANAPAVTVTEERCREVLRDECEKSTFKYASLVLAYPEKFGESHWCAVALAAMRRIASEAASPRKSERDAMPAFIDLPDGARDIMARYERIARASCAGAGLPTGKMWDEVRAYLQSTTPQTGSQE